MDASAAKALVEVLIRDVLAVAVLSAAVDVLAADELKAVSADAAVDELAVDVAATGIDVSSPRVLVVDATT